MRGCSCSGVLHRLQERFVERLREKLNRGPLTEVVVNETCADCGEQWVLTLAHGKVSAANDRGAYSSSMVKT
jgi:hypothetical protein